MDYGKLFTRAWTILLGNKYLLILGILASLATGGPSSGSTYQPSEDEVSQIFDGSLPMEQFEAWMGVAAASIVGLIFLAFVIFILLWVVAQVSRGGMITGVDAIEEDRTSSLG